MPLPTQADLRNPLLIEILKRGGKVRPREIYDDVAAHFPTMSKDERESENPKWGLNVFNNRVQWARQALVMEGMIDGSERGVWALTEQGTSEATHLANENSLNPHPTTRLPVLTLAELVNNHDHDLRHQLLEQLRGIAPDHFERVCGQLLRAMGFRDIVVTRPYRDGGIDGHGRLRVGVVSVNAAFQCKRYSSQSVGRPEIDAFRGATQGRYDHAIFLTTSHFTDEAKAESIRTGSIPIIMIDGTQVVDLMVSHQIGVTTRPLSIAAIDEDFFLDDNARLDSDES